MSKKRIITNKEKLSILLKKMKIYNKLEYWVRIRISSYNVMFRKADKLAKKIQEDQKTYERNEKIEQRTDRRFKRVT